MKSMSELERAGVDLANYVLILIGVIAVLLLGIIATSEFFPPPEVGTIDRLVQQATKQYLAASSPETLQRANELTGRLLEARRASRDFWVTVGQFLLLNLLLPVLTAILGYIFGSSKKV